MEIMLTRKSAPFHFEIASTEGHKLETDASESIGGTAQGMRPMELFLASLSACSSIDVVYLLQKQRQDLRDITVSVKGDRRAGEVPAIFTDIYIHFNLYGPIKQEKAAFAVSKSIEKYCSVSKMIDQVVRIHPTFEILD